MAIPIIQKAKYDRWHAELKLNIAGAYTDPVLKILAEKGIEANEGRLYNLVKGRVKDMEILKVLRSYFGLTIEDEEEENEAIPAKNTAIDVLRKQKLNKPATK